MPNVVALDDASDDAADGRRRTQPPHPIDSTAADAKRRGRVEGLLAALSGRAQPLAEARHRVERAAHRVASRALAAAEQAKRGDAHRGRDERGSTRAAPPRRRLDPGTPS